MLSDLTYCFLCCSYDLANCNVNDDHFDKMKRENMADVVLVKKMYADKSVRNRRRKFKLRHLDADGMDRTSVNRDYTDFLEDLEEDPAFRQNIVIYLFTIFMLCSWLNFLNFSFRTSTKITLGSLSRLVNLMRKSRRLLCRRCLMIYTLKMKMRPVGCQLQLRNNILAAFYPELVCIANTKSTSGNKIGLFIL